jgi:hypothetical protein
MSLSNCNTCDYLSKRPGTGNYFIYKCSYWGLLTQRVLPQSVVISSIGKRCPFHKEKASLKSKKKNAEKNNDGLDITV